MATSKLSRDSALVCRTHLKWFTFDYRLYYRYADARFSNCHILDTGFDFFKIAHNDPDQVVGMQRFLRRGIDLVLVQTAHAFRIGIPIILVQAEPVQAYQVCSNRSAGFPTTW